MREAVNPMCLEIYNGRQILVDVLGFLRPSKKRSFMTSHVACLTNFLKFYRIISLSSWDWTLHFTKP